jgi:membrane protein DedA with SNARE-associated domain
VSTAAGALLGFLPGLAASILGMTLCSQVGYWLGRTSGLALAQRIVPARDLERAARYVESRGDWALAASRAVPVLAEASVLLAGVLRVGPTRFFAVTLLANAGISAVYCAVGATALESGSFLLAFAGAVMVPAVAMRLARPRPRTTTD